MIRIRLSRVGAKRQPSYRVVVTNIEARRDGRFIERIGSYNPRTNPISFKIEEDRALYWLSVGAQPSEAVKRLLEKQGTYDHLARLRSGGAAVAEAEVTSSVEEPSLVVVPDLAAVAEEIEPAEPAMIAETAGEEIEPSEPAEPTMMAETADEELDPSESDEPAMMAETAPETIE